MPELMTISGQLQPMKRPKVELTRLSQSVIDRMTRALKMAKLIDALEWTRLAFVALHRGSFQEAGRAAIEAVTVASAAYRQDPKTAAQIISTAHKIVKKAVQGILAKTA
jgi:hypothetical protein